MYNLTKDLKDAVKSQNQGRKGYLVTAIKLTIAPTLDHPIHNQSMVADLSSPSAALSLPYTDSERE